MKVLVACEESQVVCNAFRARGHEAYSCDVLPTRGDHPEWHYQIDALWLVKDPECCPSIFPPDQLQRIDINCHWDLIIAFIPCDHLAVSGARWFDEKRKDGRQQAAINFFMTVATAPFPKIAIENPIGIMSTIYRKPDQIIQPWQFGHGETKGTCLWLKNLPKLKPTKIVEGREHRVHKMAPGSNRSRDRAVTFQGIADAMAEQWG